MLLVLIPGPETLLKVEVVLLTLFIMQILMVMAIRI
ncbi:uncharacterized protein METZ01_LOCUS184634 [marine metagenome]|uniref:Uncharacterized protein n=1 Tax=marine metagenome TaxID=408172 RepID=A0A382D021_9ZZZZ